MALTSSTFSGSPFTSTGRGEEPSDGINDTDTFVGSIIGTDNEVDDGRRGTDPVAARIRPQLSEDVNAR